ncbi:hypothetical protein [Pseudomonas syringae]|uniref:hypothetical protein n=1 Tax=Pseudomonas syringae TaxID=317 RepID=UPI000C0851F3|nr:hypothetical protein [Pseudomonas syringae]PHN79917.1 hypothetical protein AO071_05105 [Pseudomonas syringae]
MKSEYRQAVELVIAQESKLAESAQLHAEAAARERQLAEALRLNQEALAEYERRVAALEPSSDAAASSALLDEIKDIRASLKFLCREVLSS